VVLSDLSASVVKKVQRFKGSRVQRFKGCGFEMFELVFLVNILSGSQ